MKTFEYLRVTEQFGKYIYLFFKSIYDMRWYMAFFVVWIIEFTILYQLLGVTTKGWLLGYNQWENGIGAGGIPKLSSQNPANSL